jgi:hypothetical protein
MSQAPLQEKSAANWKNSRRALPARLLAQRRSPQALMMTAQESVAARQTNFPMLVLRVQRAQALGQCCLVPPERSVAPMNQSRLQEPSEARKNPRQALQALKLLGTVSAVRELPFGNPRGRSVEARQRRLPVLPV